MTYTKQTWANGAGGGTPISADRLAYIEDGIEAAADLSDYIGDCSVQADSGVAISSGESVPTAPGNVVLTGTDTINYAYLNLAGVGNAELHGDVGVSIGAAAGASALMLDETGVQIAGVATNIHADAALNLDAETIIANNADLANMKGFVNHGATAGTARPSGYVSIEWFGSVEPTNAVDGDSWVSTA